MFIFAFKIWSYSIKMTTLNQIVYFRWQSVNSDWIMAFYFIFVKGGSRSVFDDTIEAIFLSELIQHHSVAEIFRYYQPVLRSSSAEGLLIQLLQHVIKALFPADQSTTSQRSDAVNKQRSSGHLWLFLLAAAGSVCGSNCVCKRPSWFCSENTITF